VVHNETRFIQAQPSPAHTFGLHNSREADSHGGLGWLALETWTGSNRQVRFQIQNFIGQMMGQESFRAVQAERIPDSRPASDLFLTCAGQLPTAAEVGVMAHLPWGQKLKAKLVFDSATPLL
jgi:hypothetical protein